MKIIRQTYFPKSRLTFFLALTVLAARLLADEPVAAPSPAAAPLVELRAANSIQAEAVARYPELGRAGSPFHREFFARAEKYRSAKPAFFQNERWPVALAAEVAVARFEPGAPVAALVEPRLAPMIEAMPSPLSPSPRAVAAPAQAPLEVQRAVAAGNQLQTKPYKWGGGHGWLEDSGYDCSGSVSYVLRKAGLLAGALTSGSFASYGEPGPGRWITIYAGRGHVFMTVGGLRFDTGGRRGIGESGPRWNSQPRCASGFVLRHPPGL